MMQALLAWLALSGLFTLALCLAGRRREPGIKRVVVVDHINPEDLRDE